MLGLLVLIVVLLAAFPSSEWGRGLRRVLVEEPARRLNRMTAGRMAFYLGLGVVGLVMFGLFEVEGLRLFGFMAPEVIVWFGMFDVALFVDVFIIAASVMATARVRAVRTLMAARVRWVWAGVLAWRGLARPGTRGRSKAVRSVRAAKKTGRDDPDPVWLGAVLA